MTDNWKQCVEEGNAAYAANRVAEAEVKFVDALALAEAFGEEDPRLSLSLNNLAAVFHTQGKYTMAEPLYQRALAIKEKLHNGDHAEIALNLHNLAVLYSARKMYPVAEKHYKLALEMKERLFGADHPELLNTLKYYVQLLKLLNRPVDHTLIEARMKAALERQSQLESTDESRESTDEAQESTGESKANTDESKANTGESKANTGESLSCTSAET